MENIKLPDTWQKAAKEYAQLTNHSHHHETDKLFEYAVGASECDYIEGAQAYANAAIKMLKGESNSYLSKASECVTTDVERSVIYHKQHNLLERMIKELQSIQP